MGAETTNGDGFGVGWYGVHDRAVPARYVRYSSQQDSRTLFVSADVAALQQLHPENERLQQLIEGDRVVVSEPLGDLSGAWLKVPEATALMIADGDLQQRSFTPSG